MKLELKHLAPYLPYGLKMKLLNFPFDGHIRILELDCGHDFHFYLQNNYVRPFLRPLSDLTKEIEVNGERFVPIIKLNSDCLPDFGFNGMDFTFTFEGDMSSDGGYSFERTTQVASNQYLLFQKLAEWHFDIFGLIEAGLAIDLNTVK